MISLILGYGARPLGVIKKILLEEAIECEVFTDKNCEDGIDKIINSKVIFIHTQNLPEPVIEKLEACNAKIISIGGLEELTTVSADIYIKAKSYYLLGGERNLKNLIRYLANLAGEKIEYGDVCDVPLHGIFHPELGFFDDLKEYLSKYDKRPLVGVLFWRSSWLYGDLKHVETVVREFESHELGVVPVFVHLRDAATGIGVEIDESVEKFFMIDGKPVIVSLVSLLSFGIEYVKVLEKLNVPIFSPILSSYQSVEDWMKSSGVDYLTQVYGVIIPEVSGAIEPIFVAGSRDASGFREVEVYEEHVKYLVRRVKKWIKLRSKPKNEIKLAVVLINPPCKGLEASVAVGAGLDVPESIVRLLRKLKLNGYTVGDIPENGQELVKLILNKKAISEFRWTSVQEIVERGGAVGFVNLEEYLKWFSELPEDLRTKIVETWGEPEKVLMGNSDKEFAGMVYDGKFVVPGLRFGNVVIVPQPKFGCAGARCNGNVCKILHDPTVVPPHQWFAVYRWITRKFGADLIVHFGTHGYLEFRPGKSVGLSPSCVPEATIDDVPHAYVYVVSNPMEGVIAKRRGYATIIDHLHPPMALAEVLDELDSLLNQYAKAKLLGEDARRAKIYEEILKTAEKYNIPTKNRESEDEVVDEIHRYVELVRGTQINLGLHVFGNPPEKQKLAEYVVSAMAYDSHYSPSIRRVIAESIGMDYDEIRKNGQELDNIHRVAVKVLEKLLDGEGFDNAVKEVEKIGTISNKQKLREVFSRALNAAVKILECKNEYDGFLRCLKGEYVNPGPSGSLTRGKFDVLPTGRNFYAINPRCLPTKSAWSVGIETAKSILEDYKKKYGRYPESVGEVLWSIDAYKADGEQIAQILYLLGVEPIWKGDDVVGLRVIPLEELRRPRIDVVVRISGIVRDTLPNYIYLIDEAVEKVVTLDEPPEYNYVRKHYIEHVKKLIGMGRSFDEAAKLARFRVFGAPPGAYGAGVSFAVESSGWRDSEDLAKVWIQWGGYAYSREEFGLNAHDSLTLNLMEVDVVTRNHVSDEHDLTNCCCYFAYHGGFKNAVEALTGRKVDAVQVDTRDLSDVKVVNVKEEIERFVRAKLLNDAWIDEMKKHGYRGASEFSKKILHVYGWQATTGLVDDWVFDEIARKFVLSDDMRIWFEENNVYALEEIARRLIEAYERGLWDADNETIDRLREVYSEIEGILEEELTGDVQGGVIEVYTPRDNEKWSKNLEEVEKVWKLARS